MPELLDTSVTTPEDLSSSHHDSILLRIVRRIVAWNLKDGGNDSIVLDNHIPDSLSSALGNQHNANIGPGEETAKLGVDLLVSGVTLDDHEVFDSTFVTFAHAREQQTSNSGSVSDSGDQKCSFAR